MSWLTALRQRPLLSMLSAEVVGISGPRLALARTDKERADSAVYEGMNTAGFYAGGLALDQLGNALLKEAKPMGAKAMEAVRLGKSASMYSFLFGYMYSVPYFRNWFSEKFLHIKDFDNLVTEKSLDSQQETSQSDHHFLKTALESLGLAVAGGATALAGTKAILKAPALLKKLPTIPNAVKNHTLLGLGKNGMPSLLAIPELPSLVVWGAPSYIASIIGSRSDNEKREWIIKAATFFTSFAVLPNMVGAAAPRLAKPLARLMRTEATEAFVKNTGFVSKLASQIGFLSLSTLGQQKLTAHNLEKQQSEAETVSEPSSTPASSVQADITLPLLEEIQGEKAPWFIPTAPPATPAMGGSLRPATMRSNKWFATNPRRATLAPTPSLKQRTALAYGPTKFGVRPYAPPAFAAVAP